MINWYYKLILVHTAVQRAVAALDIWPEDHSSVLSSPVHRPVVLLSTILLTVLVLFHQATHDFLWGPDRLSHGSSGTNSWLERTKHYVTPRKGTIVVAVSSQPFYRVVISRRTLHHHVRASGTWEPPQDNTMVPVTVLLYYEVGMLKGPVCLVYKILPLSL